jgi:hypothetical protein
VTKSRAKGYKLAMPAGRLRSKMAAADEIRTTTRSVADLMAEEAIPSIRRDHQRTAIDDVLYNYDRATTPGTQPLTLDIFVKPETARQMERFVEKEYEIVDGNGVALKGRKARRHLRRVAATDSPQTLAAGSGVEAGDIEEDDGFELV